MMNKSYVAITISLLALVLSIVSLFGYHSMCIPEVVLTLIGICVTLIVGINIVDFFTLHNMHQKLDHLRLLEKQIDSTNKRVEMMREQTNISFHMAWGLAVYTWQPHTTIIELWKSVENAMRLEDAPRTHTCLDILEKTIRKIKSDKELSDLYKTHSNSKRLPEGISKEMKQAKIYNVFSEKLNDILKEINGLKK